MSHPNSPQKKVPFQMKMHSIKSPTVDNNNKNNKFSARQQAKTFIAWYKQMIDHDRQNLGLYLSDNVFLEWFGRTIKNRKKVSTFLRFDMQCSRHDFTTIESIDKIETRENLLKRKESPVLANPLHPELRGKKRRAELKDRSTKSKQLKLNHIESMVIDIHNNYEINHKGDGVIDRKPRRKYLPITPPNQEEGQGDCLPSTSGIESLKSHDALNAQLPKLAVECNGYIEFERTRNNRGTSMKWERKCKIQISYSEDPLNVGEYIIWALRYSDENKCRRNLLAAFEEVAKEEESKKCAQVRS